MSDVLKWLESKWGALPFTPLPPKLRFLISIVIAIAVALIAVCFLIVQVAKAWRALRELVPQRTKAEQRRAHRRHLFAGHVKAELQRLDNLESWSDYRFAELEAEVESEATARRSMLLRRFRRGSDLVRQASLSRALRRSGDRLIIVEGEPGAGKSVALRHVARALADRAERRKRSPNVVIPLYVNLKELDVPAEDVSYLSIEEFVLSYINRANRLDVEEFLDVEFARGLERGTWLFLFDSFDEIPAVLSAIQPDAVVRKFADAIADFFKGQNACRGVVASRVFRGPQTLSWARFRILRLTDSRQRQLIWRFDLEPDDEDLLVSSLRSASTDIRAMSSNPLFLGLLCEHVKERHYFPTHSHSVFESYFGRRLTRDAVRVHRKFGLDQSDLLETARDVAFAMTASAAIGLSPTRNQLVDAMKALHVPVPVDFSDRLDALEYLKLARSETESSTAADRPFTFAHRRFQEYFATLRVLKWPKSVPPAQLLTDGRWRETAVVLLQTQSADAVTDMLAFAAEMLRTPVEDLRGESRYIALRFGRKMHLLAILQDGYSGRPEALPEEIRELSASVVLSAFQDGNLIEQKDALECAGAVSPRVLEGMINAAFASKSRWLQDTAFQQLARLVSVSAEIRTQVIGLLQTYLLTGDLGRERYAFRAQVQRLAQSRDLVALLNLYLKIPLIDAVIHAVICAILTFIVFDSPVLGIFQDVYLVVSLVALMVSRSLLSSGLRWNEVVIWRYLFATVIAVAGRTFFQQVFGFQLIPHEAGTGVGVRHEIIEAVQNALFYGRFAVVLLVFVLSLIWAPLTALAGARRPGLAKAFWPIAPLSLLSDILRSNRWKMMLLIAVGSICGIGAVVICVELIAKYLPKLLVVSLAIVFFGVAAVGFLVPAVRLLVSLWYFVRSRVEIQLIDKPLTHDAVQAMMAKWRSFRTQACLLGHLRTRGLIVATRAMFEYLRQLGAETDQKVRNHVEAREERFLLELGRRASIAEAERRGGSRDAILSLRDEIYRLQEQVGNTLGARHLD